MLPKKQYRIISTPTRFVFTRNFSHIPSSSNNRIQYDMNIWENFILATAPGTQTYSTKGTPVFIRALFFFQPDNMRDFVDKYLKEVKSASEEQRTKSSFHGDEGLLNLTNVLIDFFLAGSETTSTTLNWGMLYMLLNPSIQKKVKIAILLKAILHERLLNLSK